MKKFNKRRELDKYILKNLTYKEYLIIINDLNIYKQVYNFENSHIMFYDKYLQIEFSKYDRQSFYIQSTKNKHRRIFNKDIENKIINEFKINEDLFKINYFENYNKLKEDVISNDIITYKINNINSLKNIIGFNIYDFDDLIQFIKDYLLEIHSNKFNKFNNLFDLNLIYYEENRKKRKMEILDILNNITIEDLNDFNFKI